MRHPRLATLLPGVVLSCLPLAALRAQAEPPVRPDTTPQVCEGRTVTRLDIRPGRPPFGGAATRWRHMARAVGLHHATTHPRIIEAFMALHVGRPCTEIRRAESERILRAQPFIAEASVRTEADGANGVVAIVETTDEIPVLVSGRTRGLNPQALSIGNSNVGGNALLLQANVERGYAYRTGFGARVVDHAVFGRPYLITLEGQRRMLGHLGRVELEHPFYTDLQRIAWHTGYRTSEDFLGFRRPAGDELALGMTQRRWDASSIVRVFGTRNVALLGVAASGVRLNPATTAIVVTDSGLRPDTGVALLNRYKPFATTRLGMLTGIRRVTFVSVHGFDALTAQQDVASGIMAGVYAAHGIPRFGESDLFLSSAAYAGHAGPRSFMASLVQVEGRRAQGTNRWDSVIGSGRAAYYVGAAPGFVFVVDDRLSGGLRSQLPLQLSLGDRQGGMLGYRDASLAGAQRNVLRTELRTSRAAAWRNGDVGVATFGELGTVWAGDAPYGVNASRATLGLSIMAAYPTRSKRLYRVDFGMPLTRGGTRGGKFEMRFSSLDRTNVFLDEPDDVARARTGAAPSTLFAWPSR